MAFIPPVNADEIRGKLVDDLSALGKLYRAKKTGYHKISVAHSLVEEKLAEGWEIEKELKTKTRLQKPKSHNEKFEDDVWCQMYDLGYRHLNYDENFNLPYGKKEGETKQIDVVAIDDDSILLIECKSSEKPKKAPSYKTEFEGLGARLAGFRKTLEQLFGNTRKIKYVFATRNLRMAAEGQDVQRLLNEKAFVYNDNTYDYVSSLIKHYKAAARYQFLALIYKGQLISKDKIEVPAVRGKMGNKTYYMFSIEPALLLKMGFILHRTRANESEMPTYQRLLVPTRLKGISKFIQGGGYFPNSVILNFSKSKRMQFEGLSRGGDSASTIGVLKIPNAFAIAYIIDGQHRIYGYADSTYKETNTIPVVAFVGLESKEQLEIFMDINQNQKAVSPTLRLTLEEDLYWNSGRVDSRLKALRSSIVRLLSLPMSGPLQNKISLGEDKALLSAKPFAEALGKSGLLPSARGNKYLDEGLEAALYNANNQNTSSEMTKSRKAIVAFINRCYELIEEDYPELFVDEGLILSNRGTFAYVMLIGSLNRHETNEGNLTKQSTVEDRFIAIEKYLRALLRRLNRLSQKGIEDLFGRLGSGADTAWLRTYQTYVNEKYKSYEPAELIDWKERQDDSLQDQGRQLGTDIERHLKDTVISNLKALHGENWDIEIGAIQRSCENRAKEETERLYKETGKRTDIPWTDMFFITDYKKIIEDFWTARPDDEDEQKHEDSEFQTFEEMFAIDVGYGFHSKKDKVKWISVFNSYRNLWAHQGTKDKRLNREEVATLQSIHDHLIS